MNNDSFQTLSITDLDRVIGGRNEPDKPKPPSSGWSKLGKVAKFAAKKAGPIGAAWTAYDGVSGFLDARKQGKGVAESLKDGALNAIW